MHRVLIAAGEASKEGRPNDDNHWNWCRSQEPVSTWGHVCDNHACGCDCSFIGIDSLSPTTRAVVRDVPHAVFNDMRDRVRQGVLDAGWSPTSAEEAVVQFDELSLRLETMQVGYVLLIDKTDGVRLLVDSQELN